MSNPEMSESAIMPLSIWTPHTGGLVHHLGQARSKAIRTGMAVEALFLDRHQPEGWVMDIEWSRPKTG